MKLKEQVFYKNKAELLLLTLSCSSLLWIASGNILLMLIGCIAMSSIFLISISKVNESNNEPRIIRHIIFSLCQLLIILLSFYWINTKGWIFTRDFGESFSVYLAAYNAKDWSTLILQDMSTDTEAVGHPFLYTHHPSLIARLSSILIQIFGGGIPENMLFNFLLISILLYLLAITLLRYLHWTVVMGAVFYAVANYTVFHENIVDLTRAQGYICLFVGLIILSKNPQLTGLFSKILMAFCIVAAAASDFAIFIYVGYVLVGYHIWLNRTILYKSIILFVLPPIFFYAIYFGTTAATLGKNFFLVDIFYTFLGRGGQLLMTTGLQKWIHFFPSLQEIPSFYHEHNVVLWSRAPQTYDITSLYYGLKHSWADQGGRIFADLLFVVVGISLFLFMKISKTCLVILLSSIALVYIEYKFNIPLISIIFVPLVFLYCLPKLKIVHTEMLIMEQKSKLLSDEYNQNNINVEKELFRNSLAFISILTMGVLFVSSIFPEYAISFLIKNRRGIPSPLIEMFSFGLLIYLIYRLTSIGVLRVSQYSNNWILRISLLTSGIVTILICLVLLVSKNYQNYLISPPRSPPYIEELSKEKYRGASFVTTSFYGQVWYFTRGWAYMIPAPPLNPFFSYWELRHSRDWSNLSKFSHPDYFLCDNSFLKGYSIDKIPGFSCGQGNKTCSCLDVAEYMSFKGYKTVVQEPDFSITDVRNPLGRLN